MTSWLRWYHFYFGLALFEVLVILSILGLHQKSLENRQHMVDAATKLEDNARELQRLQQCLLELNKPGNDLFHSLDPDQEMLQFNVASTKLTAALGDARESGTPIEQILPHVDEMRAAASQIFVAFQKIGALPVNAPDRQRLLAEAGQAMARMDDQTQRSLAVLARLVQANASRRVELHEEQERDLNARLVYERYFIAAIIVILVGMIFFGRRLQAADRMLEIERQRVQDERRERLVQIGELCSSVAHGIRNPLAAMKSSAELTLQLGQIDADSRERVTDIVSEGRRLGDRVTRLLNFARAKVDEFAAHDLRKLINESIDEVAAELRRREIEVARDLPSQPVTVNGDAHQLHQVVIELISNAMEQSGPGDLIRVGCAHANGDGMARITVDDSGPGVSKVTRSRIFDLFFTTKPSGTGIGLATVRRIARIHGGDVMLKDTPTGKGARFVVTLPQVGGSPQAASLDRGHDRDRIGVK